MSVHPSPLSPLVSKRREWRERQDVLTFDRGEGEMELTFKYQNIHGHAVLSKGNNLLLCVFRLTIPLNYLSHAFTIKLVHFL